MTDTTKKNVLVIGGGGVGTIAALNLEVGGLANVTLVCRSNFGVISKSGYTIESCDHGTWEAWKPTEVRPSVPNVSEEKLPPYDFIVFTTKNIPDIPPTIVDLVRPALPSQNSDTAIVLLQNGLNIEKPLIEAFPHTPVLSGVSRVGSLEFEPGHIVQDDPDRLLIGTFENPNVFPSTSRIIAQDFVKIYGAGGKTTCTYSEDVTYDRWRKLVYNACLNPICAINGLDTGRLRLADGVVDGLVRPAMREVVAAALKKGVDLGGDDIVQFTIDVDPLDLYMVPSMLADVRKGNYIEFENLVGEPLREGKAAGVAMPTLELIYNFCKSIQWRTKESRGRVQIPPKRDV